MSQTCVSRGRMQAFLSGELSSAEESDVVRHVEACVNCERLAAELSDDLEARQLATASRNRGNLAADKSHIDDLCRRLQALGLFELALESDDGAAVDSAATEETASGGSETDGSTAASGPVWQLAEQHGCDTGAPRLAQLGPYEIVKPLGAGSFGLVYLAQDRRLHRLVAIKVARASVLTDPALRVRFFREAEALARLEHPHIVPVYEADEIEGLCFLVLAYCEGPTLDQWLKQRDKPLDPTLAARLILPLIQAVEHAHSRGILHRDIKPGNILLSKVQGPRSKVECDREAVEPWTSDLGPWTPRLTDFGLAKVTEEERGETLAGMVLGTAHYMAPEQAAGHIERIGPATDIYSLGAVLYELISGRVPIEGNSTIDTLRRLLIDEPVELQRLVGGVPEDLGAIVGKCLHKNPSARYQSAGELADDLARFLAGRPTKARPLAAAERLSRWVRRHKALVALLGLATTAVGLSLGLFWFAERLWQKEHEVRQTQEQLGRAKELDQSRALLLAQQAYANDLAAAGKSTAKGDISHAMEALRRQQPEDNQHDLRGFEWHYLWALNTHEPQVFTDAGNEIYYISLSPNGKELATVGNRGLLRLYDAAKLELRTVIQTGQVESNCVTYAPDGRLAATAGDDGTVRVFDLATRQERLKISAHPDKAFGVVFIDGQSKLASCGKEPVIRLWDATSGEPSGTLEGHAAQVEAIALSPDGNILASAGADKIGVLWDLAGRKVSRTLKGHRAPVMSVCFSANGLWVATGAKDNKVSLWDVHTGRLLDSITQLDELQTVAFSSDGTRLFTGDRSGSVHQYRVGPRLPEDRRVRLVPEQNDRAWHAHDTRIWCIAPGKKPDTFYTAGEDQLLRRWDGRPLGGGERTIATPGGDMFVDLDFSPDGKLLFALRESSGVTAFDVQTLRPQFTLSCRHSEWRSLRILGGREEVAAGNVHGIVAIWNYKTGELRHLIAPSGESFTVSDLAYSPKSGFLAIAAYELNEARIVDLSSGELVARFPTSNLTSIALSPNGRYLALDSLDNIAIFDIQTRQPPRMLTGHAATITSLAFSPDGSLIASGSTDRTVRLWSLAGEHLVTLTGHLADVTEVAFTPDGRSLISLDDRGAAVVTHVATRQTLFELPTSAERLRGLAISPDSRRLAAIRTLRNVHEVVVLGAASP